MNTRLSNRTVLVTGGNGHVARWAIVALLRQGYKVRATLRDASTESEVRVSIATKSDATDHLHFYAADLSSDRGWDLAMDEVSYVLHMAAPLSYPDCKPVELGDQAREGTLRVLKAAERAGVERIVMTSSSQAALPSGDAMLSDERVWTDLRTPVNSYTRSKTLAELEAWSFMHQARYGMSLTTILPVLVQGPVLGRVSASMDLLAKMLRGTMPRVANIGYGIVDVRDLVDLHLRAMVAPEAGGQRFIASSDFLWLRDIAALLRSRYADRAARVPRRTVPDSLVRLAGYFNRDLHCLAPQLGLKREFSAAKAERMLDWRARPSPESVLAGADSLIAAGLA